MTLEKAFITRHTTPARYATEADPKSNEYPELTQSGVEKAKETAKNEILELIEEAPAGSVIFLGASSDQMRTAQTAEIYGEALHEAIYSEVKSDDIEVITKKDLFSLMKISIEKKIKQIAQVDHDQSLGQIRQGVEQSEKYEDVLKELQEYLSVENPSKKIIITFPLQLKGFSYGFNDRWTMDGEKTEYFKAVLDKYNGDHLKAGLDWLKNKGVLTLKDGRILNGPDPTQVAKEYMESLKKLRRFASRYTDRPIILGGVGHQWDLDALVTFVASGCTDVSYEKFIEIAGNQERALIAPAEMFDFSFTNEKIHLNYRNKHYAIS